MIRSMIISDIDAVASLQLKRHNLSPQLLPHLKKIYSALMDSPLATLQVIEKSGAIVGYTIATNDGQRLLSDIFSRMPWHLTRLGFRFPTVLKQLRTLFRGQVHSKKFDSEILDFYALPDQAEPAELIQLIQATLNVLAQRGRASVAINSPADPHLYQALVSCDFTSAANSGDVLSLPSREVLQRGLQPNPNYVPGPFMLRDRLRCAFRFELMVVAPIYSLGLIPFASYLAYLGTRLDAKLNLPLIFPFPRNFLAMAIMLLVGGLLLVTSYSYLILEGEGGPVPPYSAKTRRLVTTGPYKYVRHPSIIAKLIGVIGLAFAFNSWCFLCLIIPLLMVWSYFWNSRRQDGDLVKVFGEEYLRYRRDVPMLIPRFWKKR